MHRFQIILMILVNKIKCKINETRKKMTWSTIAQECAKRYNEKEHTVAGFRPSYLLESEDTAILPTELQIKETNILLKKILKLHYKEL